MKVERDGIIVRAEDLEIGECIELSGEIFMRVDHKSKWGDDSIFAPLVGQYIFIRLSDSTIVSLFSDCTGIKVDCKVVYK